MTYETFELPPAEVVDEYTDSSDVDIDTATVVDIYHQIGPTDHSMTTDELYRILDTIDMLREPDRTCYVARDEQGDICAMSAYDIQSSGGWISAIAVDAESRNAGVGTEFINFLSDVTRQRQLGCLGLRSVPTAIPFYRKLGFSEDVDDPYPDAPLMRKYL